MITVDDPEVQRRLDALAIDSVEQLVGAAAAAGHELRKYLGVDLDSLIAKLPQAAAIPFDARATIAQAEYTLGVAIDEIPRMTTAPDIPFAAVGASTQCGGPLGNLPAIRNQQRRGTCVAHAALAAYEHQLLSGGAGRDLSEQFLYWNCKRSDGIPTLPGTWLGVAMPLLTRDGCCEEPTWPYVGSDIVGNEGQGPAPAGAQLQALSFRPSSVVSIAPTSVMDYKGALALDRLVAFSIPVFNSWFGSPSVAYTGDITMPVPGEVRVGGHAMAIVGCIDDSSRPEIGGGRFILRNSWGTTWGIASPHGAGYGTIPYAYIARFGAEAYAVS